MPENKQPRSQSLTYMHRAYNETVLNLTDQMNTWVETLEIQKRQEEDNSPFQRLM